MAKKWESGRRKILRLNKREFRRRALNYALEQLAKIHNISVEEARKRFGKQARFDFITKSAPNKAEAQFFYINENNYRKLKPGSRVDSENYYSKVYKAWEVEKARKLATYNATVRTLAEALGTDIKGAKEHIRRTKEGVLDAYETRARKAKKAKTVPTREKLKTMVQHAIWVDLGVYGDDYPVITLQ